jgi:hypothetical protein
MRRAFHPEKGLLTRSTDPYAERESVMHLFSGAIGSYKNPHSHRTVILDDPREQRRPERVTKHRLVGDALGTLAIHDGLAEEWR